MNLTGMSPLIFPWKHHKTQVLKHQLHEKWKQVKEAKKQARIQQLHSHLAEMDHLLHMLKQKTLAQSASGKNSSQPAATSTLQNASHEDQLLLQQADLDVADTFLNQLDDKPAKATTIMLQTSPVNHQRNKSSLNLGL